MFSIRRPRGKAAESKYCLLQSRIDILEQHVMVLDKRLTETLDFLTAIEEQRSLLLSTISNVELQFINSKEKLLVC